MSDTPRIDNKATVTVTETMLSMARELREYAQLLDPQLSLRRMLFEAIHALEDLAALKSDGQEAEQTADRLADNAWFEGLVAMFEDDPVLRKAEIIAAITKRFSPAVVPPEPWIPVTQRLPEGNAVVLVRHRDRPEYPVTAHSFLSDGSDSLGIRISTNGASKHKWISWYSIGRDLCNPFEMASGPDGAFKDSAGYSRFMPNYFGRGITHWMPLHAAPDAKK